MTFAFDAIIAVADLPVSEKRGVVTLLRVERWNDVGHGCHDGPCGHVTNREWLEEQFSRDWEWLRKAKGCPTKPGVYLASVRVETLGPGSDGDFDQHVTVEARELGFVTLHPLSGELP